MSQIVLPERPGCPLCDVVAGGREVVAANDVAVVFADAYPVSDIAHWLVVTSDHVGNLFDLPDDQLSAYWDLVSTAGRLLIVRHPAATGVNVGANVGAHAGMTIPHVHTHLIARSEGDTADAKGGVRWVVPERRDYWS